MNINSKKIEETAFAGIGKGVEGIGKAMWSHPKTTLAVAAAATAALALSKNLGNIYFMINEENKRRIMNNQTKLMAQTASNTSNKSQFNEPKPIQFPLG